MKRRHLFSLTLAAAIVAVGAGAQESAPGTVKIDHPWARPTVPGQSNGGAYLTLRNTGMTPDRLLGGSTPAAARVEMHEMRMDGNVMRMREIQVLELPAGKLVKFEPGSLHLMLTGLKASLKIGDKIALTLRLDKAGEIDLIVPVRSEPAAAASTHKH